jgi:hypothetical protein
MSHYNRLGKWKMSKLIIQVPQAMGLSDYQKLYTPLRKRKQWCIHTRSMKQQWRTINVFPRPVKWQAIDLRHFLYYGKHWRTPSSSCSWLTQRCPTSGRDPNQGRRASDVGSRQGFTEISIIMIKINILSKFKANDTENALIKSVFINLLKHSGNFTYHQV